MPVSRRISQGLFRDVTNPLDRGFNRLSASVVALREENNRQQVRNYNPVNQVVMVDPKLTGLLGNPDNPIVFWVDTANGLVKPQYWDGANWIGES